jgi:phosphate transport system substrate-binding protein
LLATAQEHIRIVGSATLYPFATIIAEKFGKISGNTPIVEATGTGGGFKLFCLNNADIVNASREMRASEKTLCEQNSVKTIEKFILGYDAIVLAQNKEGALTNLTLEQIYLAIAKTILLDGKEIANPYKTWRDIDPQLPDQKIEIYGPSFASGTRDSFIEMVMLKICPASVEDCGAIREDGHYIDMSENYNLIIQKLIHNPKAIGILSYSFLKENLQINAINIANIIASKDSISSRKYPLSRPLFLYINLDHKTLGEFVKYIKTSSVSGENGYLSSKGLIAGH